MATELTPQETAEALHSIQRFFREELEVELSEMRARFVLDYFLKELAPHAYNRGVKDAENFLRGKLEDLGGICFEAPLTYWKPKPRR